MKSLLAALILLGTLAVVSPAKAADCGKFGWVDNLWAERYPCWAAHAFSWDGTNGGGY